MNNHNIFDTAIKAFRPTKLGSNKEDINAFVIQENPCSQSSDINSMSNSDTVAFWILIVSVIIVFITMIRNK